MDYFTLPGNERYYDVDYGLVHLFAIDSDSAEPDGTDSSSIQADWLQSALANSDACFNIVYDHHPPYSSGTKVNTWMRWPFQEWGADAMISGHDHIYERIDSGGFPYFINGLGGNGIYEFLNIGTLPTGVESLFRYNDDYGAMLVTAFATGITYQFYNTLGEKIDELTVEKDCSSFLTPTATPTFGPSPTATNTPTATRVVSSQEVRVSASGDDVEEAETGGISMTSSDLELTITGSDNQTIGMRFDNIQIPPGSEITKAYIQFQVDEVSTGVSTLFIQAEDSANPLPFSNTDWDVSTRLRTAAMVSWSPPEWLNRSEASLGQRTPDIAEVLQAVIELGDWAQGNSMVIIITGDGTRVAEAYDGVASAAPLLHIEFDPLGGNPTATGTPTATASNTPTPNPTNTTVPTATPTLTDTPTPTETNTPVPTASNTSTPTATSTQSPTVTDTPTPTDTSTPVPTATNTPIPTARHRDAACV